MSPPLPNPAPDCSLFSNLADQQVCNYIVNNIAPVCASSAYLWPIGPLAPGLLTCVPYSSPDQSSSGVANSPTFLPNTGNAMWQLASAALVMFQVPNVGFFYSGLAGETNVSHCILQSFTSLCIVSFLWWAWGYAIMFGPGNPYGPDGFWLNLNNVGQANTNAYGVGLPNITYCAFQCMFAAITPAIISGAIVGRMPFFTWCIFVALWTTFVYDFYGRWMWSWQIFGPGYTLGALGFMNQNGALDFAGGTVIHITSGTAALAAALLLGPRAKKDKVRPHNVTLTVIGATVLCRLVRVQRGVRGGGQRRRRARGVEHAPGHGHGRALVDAVRARVRRPRHASRVGRRRGRGARGHHARVRVHHDVGRVAAGRHRLARLLLLGQVLQEARRGRLARLLRHPRHRRRVGRLLDRPLRHVRGQRHQQRRLLRCPRPTRLAIRCHQPLVQLHVRHHHGHHPPPQVHHRHPRVRGGRARGPRRVGARHEAHVRRSGRERGPVRDGAVQGVRPRGRGLGARV